MRFLKNLFGGKSNTEAKIEFNELSLQQIQILENLDELSLEFQLCIESGNKNKLDSIEKQIVHKIELATDNYKKIGPALDNIYEEDNHIIFDDNAGMVFWIEKGKLKAYDKLSGHSFS